MNASLPASATTALSTWDNPMGTDGFEFIEYAAPDPVAMGRVFEGMGFKPVARHRHKNVLLYRQGEINFIVNAEPASFAQSFARVHGPSICAIAFRVKDAAKAYKEAIERGAEPVESRTGVMELRIPAIKGIGGAFIYLVDRYATLENPDALSIYDIDFVFLPGVEQQRFDTRRARAVRARGQLLKPRAVGVAGKNIGGVAGRRRDRQSLAPTAGAQINDRLPCMGIERRSGLVLCRTGGEVGPGLGLGSLRRRSPCNRGRNSNSAGASPKRNASRLTT